MNARRGLVILTVLVIVAAAALIATTAIVTAGGERHSAEADARRAESEALAWSGVQLALDELATQRDDLLRGKSPELTASWTLYTTPAGERAVVRLVPDESANVAFPEGARLDVNTASAESLAKVPGLDESSAQAIVAARPVQSVRDLARVSGADLDPDALSAYLTAYSYEPVVQAGVGDDARTGRKRINLGGAWTSELANAIDEQWGRGVADVVKGLRDAGATFDSYAEYVRVLSDNKVQRSEWGRIFDAVCTTDDAYEGGRVDMLRAPEAVLACVPGLDEDTASSIVNARDRLSDTERRTLTWAIDQGILTPEAWAQAAPSLTMRSLQWRVRLEAGFAPPAGETESAAALRDALNADEAPLAGRVVLEAVLDVGSRAARLAFIRDATYEGAWRLVRADRAVADDDTPIEDDEDQLPDLAMGRGGPPPGPPPGLPPGPPPADARGPARDAGASTTAATDPRIGRWRRAGGAS